MVSGGGGAGSVRTSAAAMEFQADEGTLRALMRGCESLFKLLARHDLEYWLDWGTLLGCVRHGNIIPWDYDADLCMLTEPYQRLRALLAEHGGRIDGLVLHANYYGDDDEALMLGFADWPDDSLGIDIVPYEVKDGQVRSRMSPALIDDYPGQYDSEAGVVLPVARLPMLGRHALVPRQWETRLVECYGADWRAPRPDVEMAANLGERSAPPWRALPRAWVRGGEAASSLHGAPRLIWALAEDGLAGPPGPPCRSSFTDLVFADGCRWWGRVYVGELAPGEVLAAPDGVIAWSPEE